MSNLDGGGSVFASGEADESDDRDEDRPRFCSLDPPSVVHRRASCGRRGIYEEFPEACRRGQLKQVKAMFESGDIDLAEVFGNGQTVAHIAAGYRHCHEILAYLLEKGAGFDRGDNVGAMPLHSAASSRNVGGIRLLLQWGAAVDVRDTSGCTPLFAACKARAHRVIVELLEGGASPSVANEEDGQTPLHALLYASQERKTGSKSSKAGLSSPGALTLRETVDLMIKAGAPVDATAIDGSGRRVVDVAAACDLDLMHHMLLNCNLKPADALYHAVKHGDTVVAEELLGGGKVEPCAIIDSNGRSLLHVAASQGRLECVQLLLTGAWLQPEGILPFNIDARDTAGRTALFNATLNAHIDVAGFLLDLGASPAIQDCSGAGVGYTFADTVAAEQKSDVCRLLARWGSRSGDERERAETSSTAKAPGGEVVLFPGVVSYVPNSKTEHLWIPANAPPPPAAALPRQRAPGVGVGTHKLGTNPWRGKEVDAGAFQPINSDHTDVSSPPRGAVGGARGDVELGGAAKYLAGDSAPRNRGVHSSESEEGGGGLAERESRTVSEPGATPMQKKALRKHVAGGKGRLRRLGSTDRRGRGLSNQSDASAGQSDEPTERSRVQSEATESITGSTEAHSIAPRPRDQGSGLLINQHRKLRPLAMEAQNAQAMSEEPAVAGNTTDGAPAVIQTPSAPPKSKPSKSMRTFW